MLLLLGASALAGVAGCSDDVARMGGGLTTASIGLEPQVSNQDAIIRKRGAGSVARPRAAAAKRPAPNPDFRPSQPQTQRAGLRPADVAPQSYPGDAPVSYAAPSVEGAALKPLAKAAEAPAPVVAAPVAARAVTKPKLAAAGVPVVPAAPKAPGALRSIGDPIATGSIRPAAPRVAKQPPAKTRLSPGSSYTVRSGDTLYALARRHGVTTDALQRANGLDGAALRIGQTLVIPVGDAGARPVVAAKPAPATPAPARLATPAPSKRTVAAAEPAPAVAPVVTGSVAKAPTTPKREPAPKHKTAAKAPASFAWPVRGRILSEFGERTTRGTNDGIDIAVPVGTAVRAAAAGTVIYSGSELAEFGKLVLVRHEGGWVTAYANASQNLVKRGDKVAKGQTIARSGQSGGVPQPLVHFELRRNSRPIDPSPLLER